MGINGTFLFVCARRDDIEGLLPAAIQQFFERAGATLVDRGPLAAEAWRADPDRFGLAIAPPISGWIAITDTERQPNTELARSLAEVLATAVVISSIAEICDPPEPEAITVYGAALEDRFRGLYWLAGFRYRDLVDPAARFHPAPPFDPSGVRFLTFRGTTARTHGDASSAVPSDGDLPF